MNTVFDIGNVICEWNPRKLVAKVFASAEEQQCALENIIRHNDWLMLDKGILDLDEAIDRAAHRCNINQDKAGNLFKEAAKSLIPFAETVNLIKELREKGFKLYVLSNMPAYAYEYLFSTYDFWHLFSGLVISSHVKLIKPDPKIFDHLLNKYKLAPGKTFFLDDIEVNIEEAKRHGIDAILVNSTSQMKADIYKKIQDFQ